MIVSRLIVKNWRNFRHVDVALRERQFLVGPNASGKSNLLEVFRFLRDVALPDGGGLQKAVKDRGGVSKIRCLAARRDPEVAIEVHLADTADDPVAWRYAIGIEQETRGRRQIRLTHERVWRGDQRVLDRPDGDDRKDPDRLTQTFLEQVNANRTFRDVAHFLRTVTYLQLVPQFLRFGDSIGGRVMENDPFGQTLLDRMATTHEKTIRSRLGKTEPPLRIAWPQLAQLQLVRDESTGRPHLQAQCTHWRPHAGWQREDPFSDGTLRLIGLLWSLLDGRGPLLLEEPELSLNAGIVRQIAPMIHTIQEQRPRQVLISTHSEALLTETGIDGREVLVLTPGVEGTTVTVASDIAEVRTLLEAGLTVGEVVLPRTAPGGVHELGLPRSAPHTTRASHASCARRGMRTVPPASRQACVGHGMLSRDCATAAAEAGVLVRRPYVGDKR